MRLLARVLTAGVVSLASATPRGAQEPVRPDAGETPRTAGVRQAVLDPGAGVLGATAVVVERGPYLQQGTPTAITVRWRTDVRSLGRVRYGPDPGQLTSAVDETQAGTDHAVTLTGLTPHTTYYYSVGDGATVLEGGDAEHSFLTAPPVGARVPVRVWVIGDSGSANADAAAVRDAYEAFTGTRRTDVWLMLGDNAYSSGTDSEYQAAVFDMYPELLRDTVLWSTRGNHEQSASTYYSIFTLPTLGEAGGMPSGTEAYYSFDHADVHFVCLDSFASDATPGGSMWTWLQSDLASTDQDWIVAFWHHPPYSKGSHDSDTEVDLIKMREVFLPLLEEAGVDLVLSGHSHSYERSYLIDGHYDVSSTFGPANLKDGGDGREQGDGPYVKAAVPHAGAVYCVAGCSGKAKNAPLNHPAMFHSVATLGSVVLDVDGDRLDVRFLDSTGLEEDSFTLRKPRENGLTADTTTLRVKSGGFQHFQLDAGRRLAGGVYLLLGSATGFEPGFSLGGVTLPLDPDVYTRFTIDHANSAFLASSFGQLDVRGRAAATLHLPPGLPPGLIGTTFFHSYVVLSPWRLLGAPQGEPIFASNPFPLTLVP